MFLAFWGAVGAMVLSGVAVAAQGPINARLGRVRAIRLSPR